MLLDERGQGTLGLGADRHRDAGGDQVQDHDRGAVVRGDRVGEADGELGVGATADRDQHALDLARAALLDDGDVARRLADDLVDGRGEDRGAAVAAVVAGRGLAAPAEDDQVRLLLGRGLGDALGGVPTDPDDGVDRGPGRGVVEHLLEQPTGVPGAGCALGQRHPLGHLDDAQGRQLAGARVEHRGTEPDQLLGRARVRDRDEDPRGEWRPGAHPAASWPAGAATSAFQRSMR